MVLLALRVDSRVHAAVEVHAVDTDRWVVLDTKIDVFRDTEAKVASLAEVALAKFVFLDLQTTLEDFLCLRATDGDMYSDLLITTDTEGTDGEAGFAVDGCLTAQLLQHFRCSCQSVTRFADGDVEDKLLDAKFAHRVCRFVGASLCADILAIGLLS